MKTPEELQALREEYAILTKKLKTLTEEELKLVTGGAVAAGKEVELPIGKILRDGVAVAGPDLNSNPVSEVDAIKAKVTPSAFVGSKLTPDLMCTTKPKASNAPDPSDRQEL